MPRSRMMSLGGDQNILFKGCDNMDNCSWFRNLVSWVINKQRRNMERDNLKYTNVVLERIANALEETLRLVKKDMEDSKARITEQWDKELDKKDLPFPEVE